MLDRCNWKPVRILGTFAVTAQSSQRNQDPGPLADFLDLSNHLRANRSFDERHINVFRKFLGIDQGL
jgi:hypothetical protein